LATKKNTPPKTPLACRVGVVFNQITFPLRIFAQSAPKMTHCLVNIWSGFGQDFSNLVRNSCINRFGARNGIGK
jgi:hypothetical protein